MLNRIDLVTPQRRPRVAIFSFWNEAYQPIADIAMPNWKAYGEKHGYLVRLYPGHFHLDSSRPETYGDKGKFELYYDLRGHVEYVMFLDIDSLFMSLDVRVEDLMHGPRSFLYTYDDNGPLSGLWIARTDAMTERHLRYAYELAGRENNVRHGKIEPNGISDQDAFTRLMNVPPFCLTFGLPNIRAAETVGHCYPENWKPGSWLVTFPGRSVQEKIRLMKEWSAKV